MYLLNVNRMDYFIKELIPMIAYDVMKSRKTINGGKMCSLTA